MTIFSWIKCTRMILIPQLLIREIKDAFSQIPSVLALNYPPPSSTGSTYPHATHTQYAGDTTKRINTSLHIYHETS